MGTVGTPHCNSSPLSVGLYHWPLGYKDSCGVHRFFAVIRAVVLVALTLIFASAFLCT
jgi:hypothetical protein